MGLRRHQLRRAAPVVRPPDTPNWHYSAAQNPHHIACLNGGAAVGVFGTCGCDCSGTGYVGERCETIPAPPPRAAPLWASAQVHYVGRQSWGHCCWPELQRLSGAVVGGRLSGVGSPGVRPARG